MAMASWCCVLFFVVSSVSLALGGGARGDIPLDRTLNASAPLLRSVRKYDLVRPQLTDAQDVHTDTAMRFLIPQSAASPHTAGLRVGELDGIPRDVRDRMRDDALDSGADYYPATIRIQISANERTYNLLLHRNEEAVAKDVKVYETDKDGNLRLVSTGLKHNCLYKGTVEGDQGSLVAVSLCDGIDGFIRAYGETIYIAPANPLRVNPVFHNVVSFVTSEHIVYRAQDREIRGACGVTETSSKASQDFLNVHGKLLRAKSSSSRSPSAQPLHARTRSSSQSSGRSASSPTLVQDNGQRRKYVEVLMVSDSSLVSSAGGATAANNLAANAANVVNAVYGDLRLPGYSIHTTVVGFVAVTGSDPWGTPSAHGSSEKSSLDLLQKFSAWRASQLQSASVTDNDVGHLLTGYNLDDSTVGLAWLDGMCNQLLSAGITEGRTLLSSYIGEIVTHEIGHNFAMRHTTSAFFDRGSCGEDVRFVMNPSVDAGTTSRTWTRCARQWISYYFDGYASNRAPYGDGVSSMCLENVPSASGSSCGNGIVESGEQCDPGSDAGRDPCCDASSCQLKSGSVCSTMDSCCSYDASSDTCSFSASGTVCRPQKHATCDTAEVCSGSSKDCPVDTYASAGTSCEWASGKTGSCFRGGCQSNEQQCTQLNRYFRGPLGNEILGACSTSGSGLCGDLYCYETVSTDCFRISVQGTFWQKPNGAVCSGGVCNGNTCVAPAVLDASSAVNNGRGGAGSGDGTTSAFFPNSTQVFTDDSDDSAYLVIFLGVGGLCLLIIGVCWVSKRKKYS